MAKIDLSLVQQLRERTSMGMMDCKKALEEANGDMEKAVELLRKKGAAVAAKREGNEMSQGWVQAYIHPGNQVGVLLELTCETDFVARSAEFQKIAADIGMHIAAMRPLFLNPEQVDKAYLDKEITFMREQLAEQGKKGEFVDKIVEGKLQKMYSEVCLLQQKFVKNDKLTIDELLKELIGKVGENIKIRRFVRFEIGA